MPISSPRNRTYTLTCPPGRQTYRQRTFLSERKLTERVRLFARVRGEPRQARHFAGPTEPAGLPIELPWPDIVLIEERPDGVFLFRFSADGEDAGDTWHRTVDAAKD